MPLKVRELPVVVEAPPRGHAAGAGGSPRLFFLHIMKTAGTTLCSFLEQQFAVDQFPPFKAGALLKGAAKEAGVRKKDVEATAIFDRYDYLCAHTNFLAVLPRDFRFITMLREPEARLRSLFRHWQQFTDDEIARSPASEQVSELKRRSRSMMLEDFLALDKRSIFRNFDNGMTRTLVENFPVARENALSDEQLVEEAKRTIDKAWCVGVTERFDEFLDLLCWRAGWPPVQAVAELNVRGARREKAGRTEPLPQSIERAIRLDRQVYAHAVHVFEKRYIAMAEELLGLGSGNEATPELPARLREAIDAHARRTQIASAAADARPAAVTICMSDALRGGGWLDREQLADGRMYRWTGPGTESTVDCVVAPGCGYDLRIGVVGALDERVVRGTRLFANGIELKGMRIEQGAAGKWFSRLLPRRLRISSRRVGRVVRGWAPESVLSVRIPANGIDEEGFVRVRIQTPRTIAPSDVEAANADRRQRGLAVESIELRATVGSGAVADGRRS